MGLEQFGRGDEVLSHLGGVALRLHGAALVVVSRVAAQRGQRVGRKRQESLDRQPTGDVLDVGIQPAILVDDEDRRELRVFGLRACEDPTHLAAALGRLISDGLGLDPRVVGLDLLRSA